MNAQASTKFAPFELNGVKPRLSIDLADAGDCDTADLDAEARTERAFQFAISCYLAPLCVKCLLTGFKAAESLLIV